MTQKVLIAMSGGVDSSVAAFLLKEKGYEVVGATMKLFGNEDLGLERDGRTCCALADIDDARKAADRLKVEHKVFNFSGIFRHEVISRFAAGYAAGLTPNPCVDCNRYLKFSRFWERAEALGCDHMATGHYARIEFDSRRKRYLLQKALNPDKDQSYVLYALTQKELARTLFPLGSLAKDEVRQLAVAEKLENAHKPDSQDICFVKDGDYAGFLKNVLHIAAKPGDFVDSGGQILGRHRGLIHYTVGQRRGLGLSFGRPRYVIRKSPKNNNVTLGIEEELYVKEITISEVNLISVDRLEQAMEVMVKIRYQQRENPALLLPLPDGRLRILFRETQKAVAPGQAAVFYQDDTVVGGGTIDREEQ